MSNWQSKIVWALESNAKWSQHFCESEAGLMSELSKGQHPKILWIGCSDSRCPETTLLGLKPGDVFVHRNIANILTEDDVSSKAVIEYAVGHLKVSHLVICGHTCCGGVKAALGEKGEGVIEDWIAPLRAVYEENKNDLDGLSADEKWTRLAELNVLNSTHALWVNPVVSEAIVARRLTVHALIYDIKTGRLRFSGDHRKA